MKKLFLSILVCCCFVTLLAQNTNVPELEISGQVMSDAGYDFKQINPDFWDVMRPTQLPSYKNEYGTDGNVFFSVRQSMLNVRSSIPTKHGDIKARFAFDLFGVGTNTGQTAFHILYAYVEWWKFGVGHTWSQFCDFDGFPNIVEYWGPSGMSLCKTVLIKFIPFQGANRLSIALERPGASADEGIYRDRIELQDVKPKFSVPDLSAEFRMTRKWGYLELAGIVRKIQWIDQGTDSLNLSGEAVGWGFNLSTNLNLGKNDVFKGQLIGGEGIENLMNDAPTDIGIEKNFGNPSVPVKGVAIPLVSFSAYLDHTWSSAFSSSIGYSAIFIQNTDAQKADAFRQGHYASMNLLYQPVKNLIAGIELQWILRKNYSDGWESNTAKVQFSVRYSFSKLFFKNG